MNPQNLGRPTIFGRPFVCPACLSVCLSCPVPSVCNVGVLWPNGWMDQDETWYAGRPRPWPHCVRREPSSPFPKKGVEPPQFSAHFYCGHTAGWIKMALGMKVSLGPGHIVLDGDPASPPPKRGHSPQLSAHFYCGLTVGCIKMPLDMEVELGAGHIMLDGDPAPPSQKGDRASSLPNLWPMSIVAKRLDASRCHLVWR